MFGSELEFFLFRESYAEAQALVQQHGISVTFMAKPDHTPVGSSCHIHSSLWRDGEAAFAGESDVFKHYLAGQLAFPSELAVFLAPTINSYKRFAAGSWAPTTLAWGYDNRTCASRTRCGTRLRRSSRSRSRAASLATRS